MSWHHVNLFYLLQHDQWKLLEFGPTVEIDVIKAHNIFYDGDFPVDAFAKFISDTDAPKRDSLVILIMKFGPEVFRSIFLAIIDAFFKATEPIKLFQQIAIYSANFNTIKQLAKRVQEEKILKFVRQSSDTEDEKFSCVFRTEHAKLELELEVEFSGKRIVSPLDPQLNRVLGRMAFKLVDVE